jgi:hypothetical protein
MVEAGQHAGLGKIRFDVSRRGDALAVWNLDGHAPIQFVVVGQVHPSEATITEDSLDAKAADPPWHFGRERFRGSLSRVARDWWTGGEWVVIGHGRKAPGSWLALDC